MNARQILLRKMTQRFWHSPSDAFLRAAEASVWNKVRFDRPVLDLGCGDGRIDEILFGGYKFDMGMDNDPESIERARELKIFKKLTLGDATKMPFRDKSYKTVVANSTLEHIRKDDKVLSEVSRILKPGGKFIFTTTSKRLKSKLNELGLKGRKFEKYSRRVEHFHYREIDEWKKLLKKNDLKMSGTFYYFDPEDLKTWLKLHKLAVWKPYKRELWSYLKDSRITPFIPKGLLGRVWYLYLRRSFKRKTESEDGVWIFIEAEKI